MDNDWLKENMLTILSAIGIAATLCVGAIIVLYFAIKKKAKKERDD